MQGAKFHGGETGGISLGNLGKCENIRNCTIKLDKNRQKLIYVLNNIPEVENKGRLEKADARELEVGISGKNPKLIQANPIFSVGSQDVNEIKEILRADPNTVNARDENGSSALLFTQGIRYEPRSKEYRGSMVDATMISPFTSEKHILTIVLLGDDAPRGYVVVAVDGRQVTEEAAGFCIIGDTAFCLATLTFWNFIMENGRVVSATTSDKTLADNTVEFGILQAQHWPHEIEVAVFREGQRIFGIVFANRDGIFTSNFKESIFHPFQDFVKENKFRVCNNTINYGGEELVGDFGLSPIRKEQGSYIHPSESVMECVYVTDRRYSIIYRSQDARKVPKLIAGNFACDNFTTNAKPIAQEVGFYRVYPNDNVEEKSIIETVRNNPENTGTVCPNWMGRLVFASVLRRNNAIQGWYFNYINWPSNPDKTRPSKIEVNKDVYTVNPGDTLFYISEQVYGDVSKWKVILDANPELEGKPFNIRVGMKLKIPRP